MTLGQRIQQGRKAAGWSQEDLAEMLSVSRQAVSKWENDSGYPDMEKMIRLSQMYQVSLDYLVGNAEEPACKSTAARGWYISGELAEGFLVYQSSRFIKIGICFLLICAFGMFSYLRPIGYAIGTFSVIAAVILIVSLALSDNPYKKIWTEPLVMDAEILKRLKVRFSENKRKYSLMLLSGVFVFLVGFLLLPDFYWAVPEDIRYIWYMSGDAVQAVGGCLAIYAWGVLRAYRVLTLNEEYWRKKHK